MNSLIRQYLPKDEKIDNGNYDKISFVQNHLNEIPRKVLGWKTPNQIFLEQGFNVAAHTIALETLIRQKLKTDPGICFDSGIHLLLEEYPLLNKTCPKVIKTIIRATPIISFCCLALRTCRAAMHA